MRGFPDLHTYLKALEKQGQLRIVSAPVDPRFEIAEIHRRVVANQGPALLFTNVRNSAFSVATNLYGSASRVRLALGGEPEEILAPIVDLAKSGRLPSLKMLWQMRSWMTSSFRGGLKRRRSGPVGECVMDPPDLTKLPLLTSWPMDGGAFITLPLVLTKGPTDDRPNLGMYRMQRFGPTQMGLHMQIGKGGGFHLWQAEAQEQALPATVFLGGPPALTLSAIAPLPENVSEFLFASWLLQHPLETFTPSGATHPLLSNCEFALVGHCPSKARRLEGPFGDHYGYYSLAHEFPEFHCERIYHRKGAIMPATVVGPPPQEDLFLGEYLQEAISPLIPLAMPGVQALWSYAAGGFHSLTSAVVHERYERESLVHAFRILGEGQLSLTKCLLIVNECIEVRSFRRVLEHVLERFSPETDCYVFPNLSMDTLDYAGPRLNRGSKMVLIGTGVAKRKLPAHWANVEIPGIEESAPFCPGCLVLSAHAHRTIDIPGLLGRPELSPWPLLLLVDEVRSALRDETSLIWSVFTRFDPATDLHAHKSTCVGNHLQRRGPILIDARSKVTYPPKVSPDQATVHLVSKRWKEYFSASA